MSRGDFSRTGPAKEIVALPTPNEHIFLKIF